MKEKTLEKTTENTVEEKKKKKLPKEISHEIVKKVFGNLLKAISIMLYFVILNLAYTNIKQERLIGDIQVFAGMFLVAGILILEKAYKKDNGQIAISSIELLILAFHTLSIMHIINLLKYDFKTYLVASSYVFSIYYVLKSIIIYTKGRKEYLNNLSDISEIVKKDEPLKKEAKKRNSNVEKEEKEKIVDVKKETNKETKTEKKKTQDKKTKNEKENKTKINKTKKTDEKVQEESKEKVKKQTKKVKEENKEKENKAIQDEKPKRKRGRPKKEVKEND